MIEVVMDLGRRPEARFPLQAEYLSEKSISQEQELAEFTSGAIGDEEARRRRTQKTVLERKAPPTFEIAVEMLERQRWVMPCS